MSAGDEYTASERLLLKQFKALDEIKVVARAQKGSRALKRTLPEQQQHHKPAASSAATASVDSTSATVGLSGLKQPSRLRLKQTKPQSTPPGSPPRPGASSVGGTATTQAGSVTAGEGSTQALERPASQQQSHTVAPQPAAAPTISKEALKAALAKQLAEQQQRQQQQAAAATADPAAQRTASGLPAGDAVAPAASAQVRNFRAAHKARQQLLPAAPRTPTAPAAGAAAAAGSRMSVNPQQAPPATARPAPAPVPAPAPLPAKPVTDVDYDAVSSPEIDYDAVSSPEVSQGLAPEEAQQTLPPPPAAGAAAGGAAAAAHSQAPHTPEHPHRLSAGGPSNTSPAADHRTPPCRSSARRHDEGGRPHSSAAVRRTRSRSRSRSPDARQVRQCRISSRSRSPDRSHSRRSSRPAGYSRSRSRSPSPYGRSRPRSAPRSSSRGYQRRRSRSGSRERWHGGRPSRRSSPDYGLGPGGISVPLKQRARDDSPPPDAEEGEVAGEQGAEAADYSSDDRLQHGSRRQHQQQQQQRQRTLFVGDLPAAGFTSTDLEGLFAAYGWNVVSARVMGSQCYGFVEFGSEEEAEQALLLVQDKDPGFAINGSFIRASRAKGSMPDWKRGKAVLSKRERGMGVEGLEAYEHPIPRLMRLQAAAALVGAEGPTRDLDAAVPLRVAAPVVLPPQLLGAEGVGHERSRAIIDYGDL